MMNLYFLVEGKRTEAKIYPAWLSYLVPELQRVKNPIDVNQRNYFLVSGGGYPSLLHNHIPNSVADINDIGKFDYFVVCLDVDETSVQERTEEVQDFLTRENVTLNNAQLILIVQNRCIETWLLGNRKLYVRRPQSHTLLEYTQYFNVSAKDPEVMGKYHFAHHAGFHLAYLKAIFAERNIRYTKKKPAHALEQHYLNQLLARINDEPKHLPTFQHFVEFCKMLQVNLQYY